MEGILYLTNEVGVALSQARQENAALQQALLAKTEELAEAQRRNRELMEAQGD